MCPIHHMTLSVLFGSGPRQNRVIRASRHHVLVTRFFAVYDNCETGSDATIDVADGDYVRLFKRPLTRLGPPSCSRAPPI